jgi:hypothetical protein
MKKIAILGGGTVFHVRPHLAISAPAYGKTANILESECSERFENGYQTYTFLTKMAGGGQYFRLNDQYMDTNQDVSNMVDSLIADQDIKIIFFTIAMCDFEAYIEEFSDEKDKFENSASGQGQPRLSSTKYIHKMNLYPSEKIINKIRKTRKDIFLVGCKTTTSASVDEMFEAGLKLLKTASCNLVLVNDLHTKMNMIVTPEQAKYAVSTDRDMVLKELVDMTYHRSQLTFTKSEVMIGELISWTDEEYIPESLRKVVDHCVARGAYKPFMGKTVGHFATKLNKTDFVTSIRKTNFNKLEYMVLVESTGKDTVKAYGEKPSVGGMSQRIIFDKYPNLDCIVHFHCQQKPGSLVPKRSQREFECGSHECGQNTADGLGNMDGEIYAVMLDKHGPNIVFNKNTDPNKVIAFIEENFDLSKQTSELT